MTRALLVALLALSLTIPIAATGGGDPASGGPGAAAAKKKRKKCKKGYVRKRVKNRRGKRVTRCVKKRKKAAPLVPEDADGGVYAGGAGPTEVRILLGGDENQIAVRLSFPPGTMTCTTPAAPGQVFPSSEEFRTNWEGVVNRKTGVFTGSESLGDGLTKTLNGRFLRGRRVQLTVTANGFSASTRPGARCNGQATRDVAYAAAPDGSFETP